MQGSPGGKIAVYVSVAVINLSQAQGTGSRDGATRSAERNESIKLPGGADYKLTG